MIYKTYREYGSGAIAVTLDLRCPFELESFRLHLGAGGAATDLTITIDSGVNAVYDTVLLTQAMSAITDVDKRWSPTPKLTNELDKIVIAYTNGGAATWGMEITYKKL